MKTIIIKLPDVEAAMLKELQLRRCGYAAIQSALSSAIRLEYEKLNAKW